MEIADLQLLTADTLRNGVGIKSQLNIDRLLAAARRYAAAIRDGTSIGSILNLSGGSAGSPSSGNLDIYVCVRVHD